MQQLAREQGYKRLRGMTSALKKFTVQLKQRGILTLDYENHIDRKYLVTCENEGKIEERDQCRQERMSKKDFMGEKICQLCLRG